MSAFNKNNREKGTVFAMAMIFSLAFATVATIALQHSLFLNKSMRREQRYSQALHVAEAGVDYAIWKLNNDDSDFIGEINNEITGYDAAWIGMGNVGQYIVNVQNHPTDPQKRVITSTGYVPPLSVETEGRQQRDLQVIVRIRSFEPGDLPGPLYTIDDVPHITSAALWIDGSDHAIGAAPGDFIPGGNHRPAISCTGDPATFLTGINHPDRVVSRDENDNPTTHSVTQTSNMDLYDMAASFVGTDEAGVLDGSLADVTATGGTFTSGRVGTSWGTAANYKSVFIEGDVVLSGGGGTSSYGVIVITGDLHITGQYQHTGLLIVLGELKVTGGGSGMHTYGSVLAGGADVSVTGTADMLWSSEAIEKIAFLCKKKNFFFESWMEI